AFSRRSSPALLKRCLRLYSRNMPALSMPVLNRRSSWSNGSPSRASTCILERYLGLLIARAAGEASPTRVRATALLETGRAIHGLFGTRLEWDTGDAATTGTHGLVHL